MDTRASKALAEIRDARFLKHLKQRHRCADGSLDMRYRENKAFQKHEQVVTDYYDPAEPAVNVKASVIEQLQLTQQREYDQARFEELAARVKKLELERSSLVRFKEKARKLIAAQQE